MKTLLLLSSGRFLNDDLSEYIGKSSKNLKIAHVITASKGKGVGDLSYLDRAREMLKKNGCYLKI